MARTFNRRGQTWQCPMWRRQLRAGLDLDERDLNERARRALTRLEVAARQTDGCDRSPAVSPYRLARMSVPFCGDGVPAGGPFSVRPEFSSFA